MLTTFQFERSSKKLRVVIYVDNVRERAQMTMFYDDRIVRIHGVAYGDCETPERASEFLNEMRMQVWEREQRDLTKLRPA
jgi:hypothetical protein